MYPFELSPSALLIFNYDCEIYASATLEETFDRNPRDTQLEREDLARSGTLWGTPTRR
jgi:hypothetical protein